MFDTPGTFLYRCDTHPLVMHGSITVLAAEPSPSPQPPPDVSPQPSPLPITPTPVEIQPGAIPVSGGEPASESRASMLAWLAVAGGSTLMASALFLALRLRR